MSGSAHGLHNSQAGRAVSEAFADGGKPIAGPDTCPTCGTYMSRSGAGGQSCRQSALTNSPHLDRCARLPLDREEDAMGYYSPYLIDGLTEYDIFAFMQQTIGRDECRALKQACSREKLLLLGLDMYRRHRLTDLWDDPQTPEEFAVIRLVELGYPIGLHSLIAPDGKVNDVSPVLVGLGQADWRLGWADEDGPVFSAGSPGLAVRWAFDWLAGSDEPALDGLMKSAAWTAWLGPALQAKRHSGHTVL